MKVTEDAGMVLLTPESEAEQKIIARHFPEEYLKTSKVMRVKGFVDQFGKPAKGKYIELKGCEVTTRRSNETSLPSVSAVSSESHYLTETAPTETQEYSQAVNS